jgi:hypothetical protein
VWKEPNTVPALAQPSRIAISYTTNHSILWAIILGIFSSLYVTYSVSCMSVSSTLRAGPDIKAHLCVERLSARAPRLDELP